MPNLQSYHDWLQRLQRVVAASQQTIMEEQDKSRLQRFLFDSSQFNANFSAQELQELDYPCSPFAVRLKHGYVRTTETWAMEMLRLVYQQTHPGLYPVGLASDLFWRELDRYQVVIAEADIGTQLPPRLHAGQAIWIQLANAEQKKTVKKEVNKVILAKIVSELSVSSELSAALQDRKKAPQAQLAELETFFRDQVQNHKKEAVEKARSKLKMPDNPNEKWFATLLRPAQKQGIIPSNVTTPQELQQYAKEHPPEFKAVLEQLEAAISENGIEGDCCRTPKFGVI